MDNQILPYSETYELGVGINKLSGEAKGCIFSDFKFHETLAGEGQEVSFSMERIESSEHLNKMLGISVDSSGRIGLFSAEGKFKFTESSNYNSSSLFILLSVIVKNATKHIGNDYTLDERIVKMIKDGKTDQFKRGFGDSFIEGMITGGEFYALYEFYTMDSNSKKEIDARMSASYGTVLANVEVNSAINSQIAKAYSEKNLRIITYRTGGKGEEINHTPESIMETVKQFPKQVEGNLGKPFQALIKSYETLALPQGPNYIDIENKIYVLNSYAKDIVVYRQDVADIKYILNNPDEFISADPENKDQDVLSEMEINKLNQQMDDIIDIMDEYKKEASKCADSISECSPFKPGKNINLVLPKRKGALEHVILYNEINYQGMPFYLSIGAYPEPQYFTNDAIKSIQVPKGIKVILYEHWKFNMDPENYGFTTRRKLPLEGVSCPDLSKYGFNNIVSSIYITNISDEKEMPTGYHVDAPLKTPPPTEANHHLKDLKNIANLKIKRNVLINKNILAKLK